MSHQLNRLKELHGGTDWTNKRKELWGTLWCAKFIESRVGKQIWRKSPVQSMNGVLWNENSGYLNNHWSMNWVQFKDPVSYVSCWHYGSILVYNITGARFEPFYCNGKYFKPLNLAISLKTFRENSNKATLCRVW